MLASDLVLYCHLMMYVPLSPLAGPGHEVAVAGAPAEGQVRGGTHEEPSAVLPPDDVRVIPL